MGAAHGLHHEWLFDGSAVGVQRGHIVHARRAVAALPACLVGDEGEANESEGAGRDG